MKYKTTDRKQRENNSLIISFGYCDIQDIEKYLRPNAYTCGVYGWRADFYEFYGFTISTGYAPLKYIRSEYEKERYEWIKKQIKAINDKIKNRVYKFTQSGDWSRGNKFVTDKLNNLYVKYNKTHK